MSSTGQKRSVVDDGIAAIGKRLSGFAWANHLKDLGDFGIKIRPNPNHICFMCGVSTKGFGEGYCFDNTCRQHWQPYGAHLNELYTPATVRVSKPVTLQDTMRVIAGGGVVEGLNTALLGVVVIGGTPYIASQRGLVSSCPIYTFQGVLVEANALQLSMQRMETIYHQQRPWV